MTVEKRQYHHGLRNALGLTRNELAFIALLLIIANGNCVSFCTQI